VWINAGHARPSPERSTCTASCVAAGVMHGLSRSADYDSSAGSSLRLMAGYQGLQHHRPVPVCAARRAAVRLLRRQDLGQHQALPAAGRPGSGRAGKQAARHLVPHPGGLPERRVQSPARTDSRSRRPIGQRALQVPPCPKPSDKAQWQEVLSLTAATGASVSPVRVPDARVPMSRYPKLA
jgi:hypothetical protein